MELEIIGVFVAGIIIGLLGKFVAPGDRDNIPIWLTILCGIGGVLIGWFIYTAFGGNGSAGIDWVRWLVAIGWPRSSSWSAPHSLRGRVDPRPLSWGARSAGRRLSMEFAARPSLTLDLLRGMTVSTRAMCSRKSAI